MYSENSESHHNPELTQVIEGIRNRVEDASPKVQEKVMKHFLPHLEESGENWLDKFEDIKYMVDDHNHELRVEYYPDWSHEEIEELYSVLHGKE